MMKKLLFTTMLMAFAMMSFGQATYYWVGGNVSGVSLTGGANWSTTPGGPGVSRNNTADVLIFDGVTVAFSTSSVGVGKLQMINGADISFERNNTSGTSTITLNGNGGVGLDVSGNSKFTLKGSSGGSIVLTFGSTITGTVNNSSFYIVGTASNRVAVPTANALSFTGTSTCYVNSGTYPFSSAGSAAPSTSVDNCTVFNNGTTLVYQGGNNPFGNTATATIINMKSGSNYVLEAANVSNMFKDKTLGNVLIANNATVSLSENFNSIENLTIANGATFNLNGSGTVPIFGDILNNGTFGINGSISTSNILMLRNGTQSISGSGTFNELGAITVGANSKVTLGHSLNLSGTNISSVLGELDFGVYSINGIGTGANTGRFQFRGAVNNSTTSATIVAGSNEVVVSDLTEYGNLSLAYGAIVTGPQIPANTYVTGTNSGAGIFYMSNKAIASGNSLTISSSAPTAITSNTAGIDGSVSINANGSLSFAVGTNFIFNAVTTTPFTTNSNSNLGNVTFNALATTNKDVTINGILTLNNAKLTIRPTDNVNIASSGSFAGTFDQNSYIATDADITTGEAGKLTLKGLASTTVIPVGTTSNYTPITLTPATSSDFEVNVFEGATADATPNGTPLTADQKKRIVNAVWNINRTVGTGNCDVTLGWQSALEGTDFSGFTDAQVGVASYSGTAYAAFTGSGDNTANTASLTVSSFSPMIVGELNTTLPVKLISFTAQENLNSVKLSWKTTSEKNLAKYIVQHAYNGSTEFKNIYSVAAHNLDGTFDYSFVDVNPVAGVNYYRLVSEDIDGTQYISEPKSVNINGGNLVTAYPNPIVNQTFSVSGLLSGDVIKISDLKGQVLMTKTSDGNAINHIDVQNVKPGVYILSIENSGKTTTTKRLVKL